MTELRRDPIIGRWVIVATERARRPSDFEAEPEEVSPEGFCPFCPGHEKKTPPEIIAYRGNSSPNGPGWEIRVVPNKYPALRVEGELDKEGVGIYDKMGGIGAHEVIIESPVHKSQFYTLPKEHVRDILKVYQERILDLKNDGRFRYIIVFKNRGKTAGASLEHSHSQLIALPVVPKRVYEEVASCRSYYETKERCIFCDIIKYEISLGVRVVDENESFVALSPYAARFPFELWILPKRHSSHYETLDDGRLLQLAELFASVTHKIDKALSNPSYNFLIHNSPLRTEKNDHYHWHFEFIPRLSKVAGFEWGTGFYINTVAPEDATKYLKEI